MRTLPTLLVLFLIAGLTGCRAPIAAGAAVDMKAKKAGVATAHINNHTKFHTLKVRLGAQYEDKKQKRSINMELRMERGKNIWLSAKFLGITVAKVHITPDNVQFYEKLDKRAFDGDFELISKFLGEDLNYEQLENLLLGQAVEALKKHNFKPGADYYEFRQEGEISKLFQVRPADFKLARQAIQKAGENSSLNITYPAYQQVDGRAFPETVVMEANRKGDIVRVVLDYKSVTLNEPLSFPFEIPEGYEMMKL